MDQTARKITKIAREVRKFTTRSLKAEGLVRVGTVTDIDNAKRKARVKFQDCNMTSGWLYVLDTHPHIPAYDPAQQKTELQDGHQHDLTIKPPSGEATAMEMPSPDM